MKLNDNENGNHKENYVLQKDNTDGRKIREERRGKDIYQNRSRHL